MVAPAEAPNPVEAARGVIQRVIPAAANRFVLLAIAADEGRDVFELETAGGKIASAVPAAWPSPRALNWYLKHYGHCHVSWCGDQSACRARCRR